MELQTANRPGYRAARSWGIDAWNDIAMKLAQLFFGIGYMLVTLAFAIAGLALVGFALVEIGQALDLGDTESIIDRFNRILYSIGLLTIAIASLELGQTVLEEEIQRKAHMSTPTRVRRFLSRFMILIVVSLAIEFLIIVFDLARTDPTRLPAAATIGIAAAALLAGWGIFVTLIRVLKSWSPRLWSVLSMRIKLSSRF
jgi:hypothetical protein